MLVTDTESAHIREFYTYARTAWQRKFELFAIAAVQVWEDGFIGRDFFDVIFTIAVVAYLKNCNHGSGSHGWRGHLASLRMLG